MVNWKVVLWCGVGGFALSLLVGIIGGVTFGALVLRAFLWGVVFGALGGACYYVISRFLPELIGGAAQPAPADTGENVDIVLPDENPHASQDEPSEFAEELDSESRDSADSDEMVEEVEEAPPGEQSRARRSSAAENDGFFSEVNDRGGVADELPEFGSEADTFGSAPSMPRPRKDKGAANDVLGADPEEVARAIRTVLKKDQKG